MRGKKMSEKILEVRQLATSFHTERGWQQAIDGVSFDVYQGEILGIVGESGSGKSVTAYSIMRILVEPGKIVGGEILFNGEDIVNGVYIIREGQEINTFYMSKSAGVDPTTGEQLYWAYEKNADGSMKPGSEYVTNDATVAASCKYLQGSRIPDIYGSISSSLKFRGFDLGLLFTYSLGGKIYDSIYNALMEPSFVGQTYHRNALRTWTAPGQRTDVPRTTTTASTQITDRYLIDASYFAVKNISLGYSLPKQLLGKVGIESLRIYLAADSPWIFTHLKGMNPQASFTGSTSYSYTPNRTFTLGVDLKF